MRVRWHTRSIFYGLIQVSEPVMNHGGWIGRGRMYVSRLPTAPTTTTKYNRHHLLLLPSSRNRPNQRVRWHTRGVLWATVVAVIARVGTYDT